VIGKSLIFNPLLLDREDTMTQGPQAFQTLKPKLGLFAATAIGVGTIIGAGIYVVIGIASGLAGPAIIISILIAFGVSMLTALSYSELVAWLPREGGIYEFAHELLSPFFGFITGWMWLMSNVFAGATVALGFASYFGEFVGGLPTVAVAALICLVFTVLNYIGIESSAKVNSTLVVGKLVVLAFFVGFGALFVHPQHFVPFVPSGSGVLYATVFIFFAFGGFARVTVIAEEVKDPRRTVPKAILLSLLISLVFYLFVAIVAVGLVGPQALAHSGSPLATAVQGTGYSSAVYLVSLGGLLATSSVLLTSVLGVSRVAYAMAREGDLPKPIARLHPRFSTPHYAVVISGAAMIVFVLFINLKNVVAISTMTMLFYYGVANVAALRLERKARRYPTAVPVLGLVSCLLLLAFALPASPEAWIAGLAVLALGSVYYLSRRGRSTGPSNPIITG